jgi:hypothetical protein
MITEFRRRKIITSSLLGLRDAAIHAAVQPPKTPGNPQGRLDCRGPKGPRNDGKYSPP